MSLVNQALQKVRAQQAQQDGAHGPMSYPLSPPRGSSLGWKAMVGGAIVLGGFVLAGWIGGISLRHGAGSPVPSAAAATAAESSPIIQDHSEGTRDNGRFAESLKPHDATLAAAEDQQIASIFSDTKSPALPEAPPPVAPAPVPATQAATPTIQHKAVETVLAAAVPEPTPVQLPPAPVQPAVAKGPVLVNVQTLDVPGSGKIKLMAISHSGDGAMAVINDTVVEVGDQIETATVVNIEGKRVQLKIDQKTFTLQMP